MLNPNLLDQKIAFENQFEGMSTVPFSYGDFETTRLQLIESVTAGLDNNDRAFLLSVNRLEPDWSIHEYQEFPSVKWKLQNIETFKKDNPEAYRQQLSNLEGILAN